MPEVTLKTDTLIAARLVWLWKLKADELAGIQRSRKYSPFWLAYPWRDYRETIARSFPDGFFPDYFNKDLGWACNHKTTSMWKWGRAWPLIPPGFAESLPDALWPEYERVEAESLPLAAIASEVREIEKGNQLNLFTQQ